MIKVNGEIKWSRDYDKCVVCNSTEHRHKSKGFCKKCYPTHKHEIMPEELCSKCNRVMKGYRDKQTGDFICLSCRASRIKECHLCGKEKKVHLKIGATIYVCDECSSHIGTGKCAYCGNSGAVINRRRREPICPACDVRPAATCSICQSSVKFYKHDEAGNVLCRKCYTPTPKTCIICGKTKIPHKRARNGHVCVDCYERPLRECCICKGHKLGYKKTEDGQYLCRTCYYSGLLEEKMESVKRTFAAEWIEALFLEYLDEKKKVQRSEIVWKAIDRDRSLFDKLGDYFEGVDQITHETFWKYFHRVSRKRIGQLYAFLIEKGYLDHTEEPSDTYILHNRILEAIEDMPEGFRPVAIEYYETLRKIREKKINAGWKKNEYGVGQLTTMISRVLVLKQLFCAMSSRGLKSVTEIASYHVDDFIAKNLNYGSHVIKFMLWLYQEQYIAWKYRGNWKCMKYNTPRPINEKKYNAILDRLLNNHYPLKESLVSLLSLLYGIRPQFLRNIRLSDLREDGERLFLKLPYIEIELHERLVEMVRKYIQGTLLINPFDIDNPYLFYGYSYKEPMENRSLMNILKKHGIPPRKLVSTAIHKFFHEKLRHPAVISKITGVDRRTAARYYDAYNVTVLEELNFNRELNARTN